MNKGKQEVVNDYIKWKLQGAVEAYRAIEKENRTLGDDKRALLTFNVMSFQVGNATFESWQFKGDFHSGVVECKG